MMNISSLQPASGVKVASPDGLPNHLMKLPAPRLRLARATIAIRLIITSNADHKPSGFTCPKHSPLTRVTTSRAQCFNSSGLNAAEREHHMFVCPDIVRAPSATHAPNPETSNAPAGLDELWTFTANLFI